MSRLSLSTKRKLIKKDALWQAHSKNFSGGLPPSPIIFSVPFVDLGAGAVDTAPTVAAGSSTPTFTRSTTAWTKLSTGLWASVASGTARSYYLGLDTTIGSYGGYLAEPARTNNCLQARDLTTTWVAGATMTVAKTATGIDGVTNSASTLTGGAVASTNIITQAITLGSSADTFSCWIKRISGSGTISITLDNTTYTDITSQINASTYTQVQIQQTLVNPTVGIKITTNGDSIAVDMCQMEVGVIASSPIPTTSAGVTRNADVLTYASAGNVSGTVGSAYGEVTLLGSQATFNGPYLGGTNACCFYGSSGIDTRMFDGAGAVSGPVISTLIGNVGKLASSWSGSTMTITGRGQIAVSGAFDGDMSFGTVIRVMVGNSSVGTSPLGSIQNIRIYSSTLTAAQLQTLTT